MPNIIDYFTRKIFNLNQKKIQKINYLETEISFLNQEQIRKKIKNLINIYYQYNDLEKILLESFALTREASKRTLGLRHFDTQMMGGIILNEGKIAEMKTGEGKTLVATLSLILNALSLKGAHLVTVNDYLAKRDKQAMSKIYHYLGLSVGLITDKMTLKERQKNYLADITYVTNNQLAFDYLKDNIVSTIDEVSLSDFNYCIIDEIDSVLIDEARTPLILSSVIKNPISKYIIADEISKYLQNEIHYIIEEKTKNVIITNQGVKKVQILLDNSNLYNINDPWIPFILNAIRANIFYTKDVEYIIESNKISIVDEFTGRIMSDRRWGSGLHEALEAKENIFIEESSETISSITYQNFFLEYPKLSGMTGTAKTVELEFETIYNLPVKVIPTNKKVIRQDLTDLLFINDFTKWQFIVEEIHHFFILGRPILIGTANIKNSKIISQLLKNRNIKHRLLNAKPENIRFESEIIAQAGELYAVTVSTNLSGRGSDILLGGNPYYKTCSQFFLFLTELKKKDFSKFIKIKLSLQSNKTLYKLIVILLTRELEKEKIIKKNFREYDKTKILINNFFNVLEILQKLKKKKIQIILTNIIENAYYNNIKPIEIFIKILYSHFYRKNKKNSILEKKLIKNLGGLYVIGTERHESQRIDDQLRGRSGRQGDPGSSRFYNSLDDKLLKIFATNELKKVFEKQFTSELNLPDLIPIINNVQKNVENFYYEGRKNILQYEQILSYNRFLLYTQRREILNTKTVNRELIIFGENLMYQFAKTFNLFSLKNKEFNFKYLEKEISFLLNIPFPYSNYQKFKFLRFNEIYNLLKKDFWLAYEVKKQQFELIDKDFIIVSEKEILLEQIDFFWKKHLQKIQRLKEIISWRSYGEEAISLYQFEGLKLFIETICEIKYNSIYTLLKLYFKKL